MGMTDGAGQDPSDEHAGLRALVEDLLASNLLRCPERATLILRREAAALIATDAGVAVTIELLPGAAHAPGSVRVRDGEDPGAEIAVRAEGMALLELAGTPLRLGLPDVMTPTGRGVLLQIARRRIRVRGLLRHLGTVRRLSTLLSAR